MSYKYLSIYAKGLAAGSLLMCLSSSFSLQAKVLKTAYQEAVPKFIKGEGGAPNTGICLDILDEVDKMLSDTEFKSEGFMNIKRINSELENGKLDVFFGAALNEKRKAQYRLFEEFPLYEISHVTLHRKDDTSVVPSNIAELKASGKKVQTNFGTETESFLKEQGMTDSQVDAGGKTIEANVGKLLNKAGDYFYFHDLGMLYFLKTFSKKADVVVAPHKYKSYGHYLVFRKDIDQATFDAVTGALKAMKASGKLAEIYKKYTE